MKTTTIQ